MGSSIFRRFTLVADKYGAGNGSGKVYCRGQNTGFNQDDASPAWQEYTEPVVQSWRYVQVKLVGPGG